MNPELLAKNSQREGAGRIKVFLVFPAAAFRLAIMPESVKTDQFMLDVQGGVLEQAQLQVGDTAAGTTFTSSWIRSTG